MRVLATSVLLLLIVVVLIPFGRRPGAGEIRIAVASNFSGAMTAIVERFEAESGYEVALSFGSTGKHYSQIKNGAPFDLFLAADVARPERLIQEAVAISGTRFTYAVGKIVLWSPQEGVIDRAGRVLETGGFRYIAMANPKLAPYGRAARDCMLARGLWEDLNGRFVFGENVAQTFQFVYSGNAELGFVAYSQIKRPGQPIEGSYWVPPTALYTPIEQQAVLLRDSKAARAFLAFLRGDEALKIIGDFGYDIPSCLTNPI